MTYILLTVFFIGLALYLLREKKEGEEEIYGENDIFDTDDTDPSFDFRPTNVHYREDQKI